MDTQVQDFLKNMKTKCEATAKRMNALELSVWNEQHETDLKADFGFTNKAIIKRKKHLLENC